MLLQALFLNHPRNREKLLKSGSINNSTAATEPMREQQSPGTRRYRHLPDLFMIVNNKADASLPQAWHETGKTDLHVHANKAQEMQ